jgi:hypothetical protein
MAKTHVLSDKDKGINSKLAPRYDGPYVVIALPSPVIATLAHTESEETWQARIGDMKPYVSREDTPRRPRGRPRKASEEPSLDLPSSSPRGRLGNASRLRQSRILQDAFVKGQGRPLRKRSPTCRRVHLVESLGMPPRLRQLTDERDVLRVGQGRLVKPT